MNQSWSKYKLSKLVSLKTGKLDSNAAVPNGKYPYFTCAPKTYAIDSYSFDTTAILLAGNNATGVFPIKFYNGKFNCYQRTYVFESINPNECDLKFLYFSLQVQLKFLQNLSIGAATKFLTKRLLDNLKIPLPPLPTQQKIAQILSAYDDLIENNLKRIKLLEEMAQQTYEEWFVRMKFPNHKTTPIDAETGLPEGWEEGSISSVSHVNNDSITKKTEPENIRYIDIASANTGSYENPQELKYSTAPSRAKRRVKYGDTIFSTVRPNRKIYSCVMENDPFLVASTGFAVLTPKIKDTYSFVYLSVASQSFVEKAVSVAGGAAYPAVNQKDFEKIKITIPNYKLIQSFSELINPSFKVTANLKLQNQHLKEARDILLPRLMTGMIDVDKITIPSLKISPSESENA